MRRAALVVFALLLARNPAKACSAASYDANDILTNEPVFSQNGRYLAIERRYEGLKDFESARAGTIFDFDTPEDPDTPAKESPKTVTFAIYEAVTRKRLSEVSIPIADVGELLVSDSGSIVIVRPLQGMCHSQLIDAAQAFVTIVRSDGTLVGRLTAGDVLTAHDIANQGRTVDTSSWIESEAPGVLILSIEGQRQRIDLDSATMLDPKRNVLPEPVVFAEAVPHKCKGLESAGDSSAVHLASTELLSRALQGEPLPPYPEIARKANIAGVVCVQVTVSEYGEVLAARAKPFPFGVSDAALAAVRQWRFRPLRADGKGVKFDGEVAIHFEWKVVQ